MTQITILSFAKFREMFGATHAIEVAENATVLDALVTFAGLVPAAGAELFEQNNLRGHVILMYNRERIDAEDAAEIKVAEGDELVLYPPVSGG